MKLPLFKAVKFLLVFLCINAYSKVCKNRQLIKSTKKNVVGNLKSQAYSELSSYDTRKIRGVNLGGWLLLEPWITPSLYANSSFETFPVDEYHLSLALGKDSKKILKNHWENFIKESDFKKISYFGFNYVRIPIGYWAFKKKPNDPYVQGQTRYLNKALNWCRSHNLKVWIDLHGAPGSQNGFDNSGLRDNLKYLEKENLDLTLEVLETIFKRYGTHQYSDVVAGIQILNEPLGASSPQDALNDLYSRLYHIGRNIGFPNKIVFHDAFFETGHWLNFFKVNNNFVNIMLDKHRYTVFSIDEILMNDSQRSYSICDFAKLFKQEGLPVVVGEWSGAVNDCSKWLNGVGKDPKYLLTENFDNYNCDIHNDMKSWTDELKSRHKIYIENQISYYEKYSKGWFFWTWKSENENAWNMEALINNNIISTDFDSITPLISCNI